MRLRRVVPLPLVVLGLLAVVPAVGAATFFVDRSNPSSSDSNPGTEALPWKTIQKGASTAVAGDTVWVKRGSYPETVSVANSGTGGNEIVFSAWPGDVVTIDGATVPLLEWNGLVQIVGVGWVRFSGFTVAGSQPFPTNAGIQVEEAHDVVVSWNHTTNTASSGIIVWNSRNVLVESNEVDHAMTTGADSRNEGISVGRTDGFEVRGNHVHDWATRGEGICLKDGSSNGSVHHNRVHDVPNVGIYVDAWTEHTHHIDVWANDVARVTGGGNGIAVASEQGGLLESVGVFDNVSRDNRTIGILVSDCCAAQHPMKDIRIVNNSARGNGTSGWGGGIVPGNPQATGVVVRNNAVAGNLSFEIDMEGLDPSTITADHNLIGEWHGYPGELCGTGCVVGDPRWVDPAAGDFHLAADSPAIDHGSSLLAPAVDFDGVARPQGGAVDIGAYEFVPAASCILSCGAEAPATATVGVAATFTASATATGCSAQPSFTWTFGDGATATGASATHAYAAAGSWSWSVAVTADGASCTKSGTIVVTEAPPAWRWLVPAVTHAPGAAGTAWRTSVAALNPGRDTASLSLRLRTANGRFDRSASLAAGATVEWIDVAVSLFGADPASSTLGALEISSDRKLVVTSRTYNETSAGTFGQNLPALTDADVLAAGTTGYLVQIRRNGEFRTNVGFANPSGLDCDVRLRLFDAAGLPIGSPATVTVRALSWTQTNDVFGALGAGDRDLGRATVEILTPGGSAWAYASVVDNRTGDATTVPVVPE